MKDELGKEALAELLTALGEHLAAAGERDAIVIVGGASIVTGGWVDRVTKDVDVIARVEGAEGESHLIPPEPLPPVLQEAVRRVARDYGLPKNWFNTEVAAQWMGGLPPGVEEGIRWESFAALTVGFAGRGALIALKLFAAVDQGPNSIHTQDLVALEPLEEELDRAAEWVMTQDRGEHFAEQVREVVEHVHGELGKGGEPRT